MLESLAREVPTRVAAIQSWSWGFTRSGREVELAILAEVADWASFDALPRDASIAAAKRAAGELVCWEGTLWTDDEFPCVERDDTQGLSYNGLLRYVEGTSPGRREQMKRELVKFGLQHPDIKAGTVGFCTSDMTDGWDLMWQWGFLSKEAAQRYWRRPGHGTFLRSNQDTFVLGGDGVSTGHFVSRPRRAVKSDDQHGLSLARHVVLVPVPGHDATLISARLQTMLRTSSELDARAVTAGPFSATNVLGHPRYEGLHLQNLVAVVADFDNDAEAHGPQLKAAIGAAVEPSPQCVITRHIVFQPAYPHLLHTLVEPDGRLSLLAPSEPWRPPDADEEARRAGS